MKKIALLCAIPQERRPILRRLCRPIRGQLHDLPIWSSTSSDLQVTLVETGIGITRAAEAAKKIIKFASPDIVISTGFCGTVKPGLRRGDIVLAERILQYRSELHSSAVTLDKILLEILSPPGKINFHFGTFITVPEMVAKCRIAAQLDDQNTNPVIEMESLAVAEVCNYRDIPFAAIRVVSDTADNDPQPVCSKIFAADMKVSMIKILSTVMTAPLTTRKLLQMHVDAEAAGRSLAKAIALSLERLR
jgi:adenosylhomocysteine nucleosidase